MQITAVLRKGRLYSKVEFEDGTLELIPNEYAAVGKDYISDKMLKDNQYTQYEGDHISARFDGKHSFTLRNKDNICSATLARNQKIRGARKAWRLFIMEVSKTDTFAIAVDYFERHGIKMLVSG
jgi:hypothetical protein